MEVTQISAARGQPPHEAPIRAQTETVTQKTEVQRERQQSVISKKEIPPDLAAEHIAASLMRNDPSLDEVTAQKIAKRLLSNVFAQQAQEGQETKLTTLRVDTLT